MGEKNAFFKKVFLLSTKSITRETRLVSLVKQGNIMEGTQKRESNYYFLIKVLPKQCLKISQKSYFNFQSKGQRHLNFRSKIVLFEKNTNTTVNISITLFLSLPFNWDNYDDFPTLWLVPSLFGPSWQHVSRPASSSLSYLRTSEVQMREELYFSIYDDILEYE